MVDVDPPQPYLTPRIAVRCVVEPSPEIRARLAEKRTPHWIERRSQLRDLERGRSEQQTPASNQSKSVGKSLSRSCSNMRLIW